MRLAGSNTTRRGRVELYLDGVWGTVGARRGIRRRTWAADTICRQLGYSDSSERGTVADLR